MTLKLDDITIERVKLAYQKIGKSPAIWQNRDKTHCCALQALAEAEGFVDDTGNPHWGLVLEGGAQGFIRGFDLGIDLLGSPAASLGDQIARELGLR